ncbi:nitroreductase family protein [Amedibacillus sp. YH-ame6]
MFMDLVVQNRSYRGYDESRKITKEEMLDMINHARLCASSVNKQPLKYYVAYDEEMVKKIQPLTGWAKALDMKLPHDGKCPTGFIVICQDTNIMKNTDAFLRDVGIVAQTMLLRAVEMRLGGCMIGNFKVEDIQKTLHLKEGIYPHLILAIGKPDEEVIITDVQDQKTNYYRDEEDRHYVPKRYLEDLLINE